MYVQVNPQNPRENVSYICVPWKKYPDLDQPKVNFPDLTQPKNILKNAPWPQTTFSPVCGNLRFRVVLQVFIVLTV